MRVSHQNILAIVIVLTSVSIGLLVSFGGKSAAIQISAGELDRQLKEGTVAVMFWSETCSSCELMRPYWMQVESSPPNGVRVTDVPLVPGKTDRLFMEYKITETPTFLILKDGAVVDRIVGAVQSEDPALYFRRWIESTVETVKTPSESATGWEPATLALLPILGALVALSPCSAPIVAAYATMGRVRGRGDYAICLGSSFAGTMVLGSLMVIAASFVAGLIRGLTFALAVAAIMFGVLTIFTASESCPLPGQKVRGLLSSGLPAACFSFGLVSLQCSLPLLAGYIALISATGDVIAGVAGVALLALGMAAALVASLYLAKRATGAFSKAMKNPAWLERVSGGLLVVLGVYLLIAG